MEYWPLKNANPTSIKSSLLAPTTGRYHLKDLEPGISYSVSLQFWNPAGFGQRGQIAQMKTPFASPSGHPLEVTVLQKGPNDAIRLKWTPVASKDGEEPLDGYQVRTN